jgi:protein TonB
VSGAIDRSVGGFERRDLVVWCASFVTVLALHGAAAWAILSQWEQDETGASPAVAIELAMAAAAPSAERNDAPPSPIDQDRTAPQPEAEQKPDAQVQPEALKPIDTEIESPKLAAEPVEKLKRVEEAAEQPSEQPQPIQAAALKVDLPPELRPVQDAVPIPDVLPAEKTEVAVAPPPPPLQQPPQAKEKKEVEKKPPPKKKPRPRSDADTTRKSSARAVAARATASNPIEGRRSEEPAWRARMAAHVKRHLRYPTGARSQGAAVVAFTIDRAGRVTSARLARSAGASALDQEAVAAIRRASPVPPPPSSMTSLFFSIPLQFNLR